MMRLRRALGRLAVSCLVTQALSLALVPTVVFVVAAENAPECTCAHGDHTFCPMHHRPAPGSRRCQVTSDNGVNAAIIASLLGTTGETAPAPNGLNAPDDRIAATTVAEAPHSLAIPPDSPPPRL